MSEIPSEVEFPEERNLAVNPSAEQGYSTSWTATGGTIIAGITAANG